MWSLIVLISRCCIIMRSPNYIYILIHYPVPVTLRPPQIPLVLITKFRGENLSHRTPQSEGHNRCTPYAVHTVLALGIEH
jgi:hypothetical protein